MAELIKMSDAELLDAYDAAADKKACIRDLAEQTGTALWDMFTHIRELGAEVDGRWFAEYNPARKKKAPAPEAEPEKTPGGRAGYLQKIVDEQARQLKAAAEERKKLEARIAELEEAACTPADMQGDIKAMREENDRLTLRLQLKIDAQEKDRKMIDAQKARIEELEADAVRLETEKETLREKLDETQHAPGGAEDYAALLTDYEALKDQLEDAAAEYAELEHTYDAVKAENVRLAVKLEQLERDAPASQMAFLHGFVDGLTGLDAWIVGDLLDELWGWCHGDLTDLSRSARLLEALVQRAEERI